MEPTSILILLVLGAIPAAAGYVRFRRHSKKLEQWRKKRPESIKRRVERI